MTEADRDAGTPSPRWTGRPSSRAIAPRAMSNPAKANMARQLYNAVCAVCHEAENRATMVPDLHALKVPTNEEFWRTWITHGKPGSLMPAFSTIEGGPLNDMQIASLAAYLNRAIRLARPRRRAQVNPLAEFFRGRYPVNHDSDNG